MDECSEEILRRVQQNHPTFTTLSIGYRDGFTARDASASDYSTLGLAIAQNTNLARLEIALPEYEIALDDAGEGFFEGLKQNTSIHDLEFSCNNRHVAGGVISKILNAYQANIHLTRLTIEDVRLDNGGDSIIAKTLKSCTNLRVITLRSCNITDEQLVPMVEALRGQLDLGQNEVGNAGCDAIATLIDANSNLRRVHGLNGNSIDHDRRLNLFNIAQNRDVMLCQLTYFNSRGQLYADRSSEETLLSIQQNDPTLTSLSIGEGGFYSGDAGDFSLLGSAISRNTRLTSLGVDYTDKDVGMALDAEGFIKGLKRNSSIRDLRIDCYGRNIDYAGEILKAYEDKNNLTRLNIVDADLGDGGDQTIATTLRRCTNLKQIIIEACSVNEEQLLPMVEALRGHLHLEELHFHGDEDGYATNIGNAGRVAIGALLEDSNCNLCILDLEKFIIDRDGANILANSLTNNTKLKKLRLHGWSTDDDDGQIDASVADAFTRALGNTSSVNQTYSSNHSLVCIDSYEYWQRGQELESLLTMNKGTNKKHVAIKKILKYHPNIDMEPFFEWDKEREGKALPFVVDWFERVEEAIADDENGARYNIDLRKLSTIYQFSRAMPSMFEGITISDNKRKRRRWMKNNVFTRR